MMATKTKKRKTSGTRSTASSTAASAAETLRERWQAALKAVATAEAELEKQWQQLVKKSGLSGKDAKSALAELRVRLEKERQRALKGLEAGVAGLQARVKEEGASLSRKADEVMKSALVAFNIPSRQEVGELTRKVDELSRKIDAFKAKPSRPSGARKATARKAPARKTPRKAARPSGRSAARA
jgi:polyhydroxyalkanoate synthesis regulator phasin